MTTPTEPSRVPPSERRARARRERERLVIVLAVTSGATDAVGFLALGSAFTSVMTGNMVLLGVGAASRDTTLLLSCAVAISSFVVGAAIGARVAGSAVTGDAVWPRAVSLALWIELALFVAFAALWWGLGSDPDPHWLLAMLGLNASALGLQSSAIQRFGVSGLSTTYLTGTLTTVVIRLSSGHGLRNVGHSMLILLGLVTGAAVGALMVGHAAVAVPAIQLLTVLGVLIVVRFSQHLEMPADES